MKQTNSRLVAKKIPESEKLPFDQVGGEKQLLKEQNKKVAIKPVVSKIRNRNPLPMPVDPNLNGNK